MSKAIEGLYEVKVRNKSKVSPLRSGAMYLEWDYELFVGTECQNRRENEKN